MSNINLNIKDLPYSFPKTQQGQLDLLAEVLDIPNHRVKGAGETEIDAMVATILYRHLDRHQRIHAIKSIRQVKNGPLMGSLLEKAINPIHINSNWGIWSLTNEELLASQSSMQNLDDIATTVGLGLSGLSVNDLIKDYNKNKIIKPKHIITVVIMGIVFINNNNLNKANTEIKRRSVINKSSFY